MSNELFEGIALTSADVELPPRIGVVERVSVEYRKDDNGSKIMEHNGRPSRNLVLDLRIPGVTDTWENGVKVQRIRLGSKTWMTFLDKLDASGFTLTESPTELEGETFEFEVEERKWTTKDDKPARWVIDWPSKHVAPE